MIFLDNASTTQQKFFAKEYTTDITSLNANAEYAYKTRKIIEEQKDIIRHCLGVTGGGIIFTRCATESAELFARKFQHNISCSSKEHDSVFQLRRSDKPHDLANDLTIQQTVNQITGECFKLPADRHIALDMTAGIGKVHTEIPLNCKALWFSGHKFHAPHIGVLWLCDQFMRDFNANVDTKNQYDLLHGTIDCASIIALTEALQSACSQTKLHSRQLLWGHLESVLYQQLNAQSIQYRHIYNLWNSYTPAIQAIQLQDINADALQQYLASKDIFIGIGDSACVTSHNYRVLIKGYGLSIRDAEQVVRISFSEDSTEDEVIRLVEEIAAFKRKFID